MSRDRDIRSVSFDGFELREEDGKTTARGYAAVYNSLSVPIYGMFRERIRPGAFRRSLAGDGDVFAFWQHDSTRPLARRSTGTLRLREDDRGLAVEIDLPDTSYGRDAADAIRTGLVDKMSFGFAVADGGDVMTKERADDGLPIRELTDVDLYEVSPVTMPAYEGTELSARSQAAVDSLKADLEGDQVAEAAAEAARIDVRLRRLDLIERAG